MQTLHSNHHLADNNRTHDIFEDLQFSTEGMAQSGGLPMLPKLLRPSSFATAIQCDVRKLIGSIMRTCMTAVPASSATMDSAGPKSTLGVQI
jgi:hypothetical protein